MSDFRLLDLEIDRIDPCPASEVREQTYGPAIDFYGSHLDDMPPIHVFAKSDGKPGEHVDHWLGDGNHTLLAHIKKGRRTIKAMVKFGTYADAFRYACGANQNLEDTLIRCGVPVHDVDKKRRVEVWCSRPEAKGMTQKQVAAVCGVTSQYVGQIAKRDAFESGFKNSTAAISTNDTKRADVAAALKANPDATNNQIAEQCGVHRDTVRKVRKQLGIENPRPAPGKNGTPKPEVSTSKLNGTPAKASDDTPAPVIPLPGQTEMFQEDDEEESIEGWWRKQKAKVMADYDQMTPQKRAIWRAKMGSLLMTLNAETPGFVDRTKEAM